MQTPETGSDVCFHVKWQIILQKSHSAVWHENQSAAAFVVPDHG